VKVLEYGGVYVTRARRGVSEVFMDSGTEFEYGDRKVVGERSVSRVEGDRVGFGLGFKVEEMATLSQLRLQQSVRRSVQKYLEGRRG